MEDEIFFDNLSFQEIEETHRVDETQKGNENDPKELEKEIS